MKPCIKLNDVTLEFSIYHNKSPGLKETALRMLGQGPKIEQGVRFEALKKINLTIEAGERVGIIGLNGAGKSTLLKLIAGIYTPTSGDLIVNGSIAPLIELGTGIDIEMTGRENIHLTGTLLGKTFKETQAIENQIILFSGLGDFIDLPMKYYSSGMISRLVFSIGMSLESDILMLDEVFSTGDKLFTQKATEKTLEQIDKSHIVLFISHGMDTVQEICNRVIVLHHGEIVKDTTPKYAIRHYFDEIAVEENSHPKEELPESSFATR